MTTFYLDPEAGNDANAGTSFALRWKTWQLGATSARIAPGDTIRVIASRDAYSIGNATFTDDSGLITLAAAKTLTIDTGLHTNWTAATNVTKSSQSVYYGNNTAVLAHNFAVAAGFTTGIIAYRPITIDLSGYTAISFLLQSSLTLAATTVLNLCSDAVGAVPIVSIPLTLTLATGTSRFKAVLFENGSALPSNVNSISLSASVDPGTVGTLRVLNIIACQARGHADHLSHACLIGKGGSEPYYNVSTIDGVSVGIHGINFSNSTTLHKYRGTTATVTAYVIDPLKTESLVATAILQESGSVSAFNTISGGWDRTSMASQTGVSWISGLNNMAYLLHMNGLAYWNIEKLGFVGTFTSGMDVGNQTSTSAINVQLEGIIAGVGGLGGSLGELAKINVTIGYANQLDGTLFAIGITGQQGYTFGSVGCTLVQNCALGFDASQITQAQGAGLWAGTIRHCAIGVRATTAGSRLKLGGNPVFDYIAGEFPISVTNGSELMINCPTISYTVGGPYDWNISNAGSRLRLTNINNDPALHLTNSPTFRYYTKANANEAGTGYAWVFRGSSVNAAPAAEVLGRVWCEGGVATTVSCRAKKDATGTNMQAGIFVLGKTYPGVVYQEAMLAENTSWQTLSLTFTPTIDCVVEINALISNDTTTNAFAYFDQLAQV